jgi:GNAT superfamily N-acetyltransferase
MATSFPWSGGLHARSRLNGRVRLERIVEKLPFGFDLLRAEAQAEGYRHLERLAEEWSAGTMRFDREGEVLLGARFDADLAGIGGLTIDPALPGALRMRRFYVGKSFRRHGIGRALAEKLLAHARFSARLVTVNAAAGSEPFWEPLGFVLEVQHGHTHVILIPEE